MNTQIENKHLRAGLLPSALLLIKGLEVQMAREFYVIRGMLTLRAGQVISTTAVPHSMSCRLEFLLLCPHDFHRVSVSLKKMIMEALSVLYIKHLLS